MGDRDRDADPSIPAALDDEPAAAEEVYVALFVHGPDVTTQTLVTNTSLSEQSVRNYLETLEAYGLAESRPDWSGGARWRYVYSVAED